MLAYSLKKVLSVVPEALDLVKKADIEEEFPVNNKDSAIGSYLAVNYLMKVAHQRVGYDILTRVTSAVEYFGAKKDVEPLIEKISSYALAQDKKQLEIPEKEALAYLQAEFEGNLTGFMDIEKVAEQAQFLYDTYKDKITSDEVKRYACEGYLNKEAAVGSLIARYEASKNESFLKAARLIQDNDVKPENLRKVARLITLMDRDSEISARGFNFYKECITKEAGVRIKIAGSSVPYENIVKFGNDRIGHVLGKDVAEGLGKSAMEDKQVLESLPYDLQKILYSFVKVV